MLPYRERAMSDAERFDAFYAEARSRLLVQAFALTGDLPASRAAVRDSFIAAWHHWRKIGRTRDPEEWLRPHAWSHAQRRHTTRVWHRDRKLDPEIRKTLDALARLTMVQRKTLLLTQLSTASRQVMAREVGLPLDESERRLQTATSQFSLHREVPTTAFRPVFDQLREYCDGQRWPRATIVRRAGTARRRGYAAAGVAVVVAALVGSGFAVQDQHGVHPTLAAAGDRIALGSTSRSPGAPTVPVSTTVPAVTAANLVARAQVTRALPGRRWTVTQTAPADAHALPCQQQRYADSHAQSALVRTFEANPAKGKPDLSATQTTELSATDQAAARAYATTTGWFAGCTQPRTQLVDVRRVTGLGEQAQQFVLHSWDGSESGMVLGVARTGRATTVALTSAKGAGVRPDIAANLRLLTSAVDNLCGLGGGGSCSSGAKSLEMPAPTAGNLPMMLSEFDLPMVTGVPRAWAGTSPRKALQNLASTGCDHSTFRGKFAGAPWKNAATRTFLMPRADLSDAFGLTETVGKLPSAKAAAFLTGVRKKLSTCADRELGTKVLRVAGTGDLTVWRVRTEISAKDTVTFWMGVARRGGVVAQVGFVPDGRHTVPPAAFVALVHRAQDRLAAMH
jgi:DNA-directed RNA polymerase specialized sigma24 family protein